MQKTFWTVLVLSAAVFCPAATAQPFGLGVKLGSTLTNSVSSAESETIPNSATLIAGLYAEVHLPLGFSVEGDALYYPSLYSNLAGGGSLWQFPILAKLKFLKGPIRPYVEGGPAYSHLSDVKTLPDLLNSDNFGITLGAGIEFKVFALRLSPELRYNGVILKNLQSPEGFFQSNRNQAVFLLGIGF
jgi:opacity protein-like surface antigen